MKHTQGKLVVKGLVDRPGQCNRYYIGTAKKALAQTCVDNTKANAERLVLCWNTHDDLLEALKDIAENSSCIMAKAVSFDAIAKVEGGVK